MKYDNKHSNQSILLWLSVISLAFILLGARFFQLAIVKNTHGVDLEEYSNTEVISANVEEARRGTIFDSNMIPLGIDSTTFIMYAVLQEGYADPIDDVDHTAKVLSQYINLSRDEILEILLNPNSVQVEFGLAGSQLSKETKEAIEAENLSGVYFYSHNQRQYINDYFASHLIGYTVESDNPEIEIPKPSIQQGMAGIEAAYDNRLSGKNLLETNPDLVKSSDVLVGQDLQLTLDSRLQNYLEPILEQVYTKYQPELVSAYLVDVETGKLLSAGQRPSYNLNTLEGIEAQWEGQLVAEMYEPGSTIKILTQGVAYDLNLYNPWETVMTGSVSIEGETVKDYNIYGWGQIPFDEALARSSNVSMVELVRRIGIDRWVDYLHRFGFGESTESGLPNEASGIADFDNPVSRTMSGFGQGFAATPMQLMQAYTTIGNLGQMLKIQYIIPESGYQTQVLDQIIDEDSARHIINVMRKAVTEPYGTALDFNHREVEVAAKTGTAQIANPNGAGYLTGPNDYYFSVVSFFPYQQPKYMLYLTLKRPLNNRGRTGSQILSEIFHPFVSQVLVYE